MIKISAKSQYGLRAALYLAKFSGKISSMREISKNEGIPFDYLEKIISALEKGGVVGSKKGVRGGYFLASSPNKIKIGKIIRALEGEIGLVKCVSQKGAFCPKEKKCQSKNFWKRLQNCINYALDSITLADLIGSSKK